MENIVENNNKLSIIKELNNFGLDKNEYNIKVIADMKLTTQHPDGYCDIWEDIDDDNKLSKNFEDNNIKSFVHAEGRTVRDHVKKGLEEIEKLQVDDKQKKDLKLIFLYHDYGKTIVHNNEINTSKTVKKVSRGELFKVMIGHSKQGHDFISQGLLKNGIDNNKVTLFLHVINNHMESNILNQDPKKIYEKFNNLFDSEKDLNLFMEYLGIILSIDGKATDTIKYNTQNGKIIRSNNDKKIGITGKQIIEKYKEGEEIVKNKLNKDKEKQLQEEREKSILGKKITDYLINDRGLEPGPKMWKIIGKIRGIINNNKGKDNKEILLLIEKLINSNLKENNETIQKYKLYHTMILNDNKVIENIEKNGIKSKYKKNSGRGQGYGFYTRTNEKSAIAHAKFLKSLGNKGIQIILNFDQDIDIDEWDFDYEAEHIQIGNFLIEHFDIIKNIPDKTLSTKIFVNGENKIIKLLTNKSKKFTQHSNFIRLFYTNSSGSESQADIVENDEDTFSMQHAAIIQSLFKYIEKEYPQKANEFKINLFKKKQLNAIKYIGKKPIFPKTMKAYINNERKEVKIDELRKLLINTNDKNNG